MAILSKEAVRTGTTPKRIGNGGCKTMQQTPPRRSLSCAHVITEFAPSIQRVGVMELIGLKGWFFLSSAYAVGGSRKKMQRLQRELSSLRKQIVHLQSENSRLEQQICYLEMGEDSD